MQKSLTNFFYKLIAILHSQNLIKRIIPPFILLGLILLFFGEKIIPTQSIFIGGTDVRDAFFWWYLFAKKQIFTGGIPLWNPYIAGGIPFTPNPSYYPSFLLFLIFSMPWAFNIDILLHFCIAGVGMYSFVYMISNSKLSGIVSGIIYCLNGYVILRLYSGHLSFLYSVSFIPWVFFFAEKGLKTGKSNFLMLSGLVLGIMILDGDPQLSFYAAFSVTIYYFIHIFSKHLNNRKILFKHILYFFFIPLISFGISAIQLIPLWDLKNFSSRAHHTYEAATIFPFPFENFFTFLIPFAQTEKIFINWETSCYIGILPIILAFIGIFFSQNRIFKWPFVILIIISISIMLGAQTPLYTFYYHFLPLIKNLRYPCRMLIIMIFSLSVLSGFGAHYLTSWKLTKKQNILIFMALSLLLISVFLGGIIFKVDFTSKEMITAYIIIFCSFMVLLCAFYLKNKYAIGSLIILTIFFDLLFIYRPFIPQLSQTALLEPLNFERPFIQNRGYYRVLVSGWISTYRSSGFEYFNAGGYAPTALNDYARLILETADLYPAHKYYDHFLPQELFTRNKIFSSKILNIKYGIINTPAGKQMVESKEVTPRTYLVKNAIFLPDKESHLALLKQSNFDPLQNVLLLEKDKSFIQNIDDKDVKSIIDPETNNDFVQILKYKPNKIEINAYSHTYQFLVLSENYYPGWHAYVDGKEVTILRANYLLRAIPLNKGNHNITFIYKPFSFKVGSLITAGTIIFLLVFFVSGYFLRKTKNPYP